MFTKKRERLREGAHLDLCPFDPSRVVAEEREAGSVLSSEKEGNEGKSNSAHEGGGITTGKKNRAEVVPA